MRVDKDALKSEFSLRAFGAKGWQTSPKINCPYCGRGGKFGFMFSGDSGVVHCFFCGTSKPITTYLTNIDRKDLIIKGAPSVSLELKLSKPNFSRDTDSKKLGRITMPHGVKFLTEDEYLDSRGFTKYHYDLFQPSYTNSFLEDKLKGYIIFKIFQDGELVSWLARSRNNYEWHKKNLEDFKNGIGELKLRYINSTGTDFDMILGGIDEVTGETDTVIIVEGMFDKINVDKLLNLGESKKIKCLFSFGNKVSDGQVKLLKCKKSVKNIILLYDFGTQKQSRGYGLTLQNFWNVRVAEIKENGVDPGDITKIYLDKVISEVYDPLKYRTRLIK